MSYLEIIGACAIVLFVVGDVLAIFLLFQNLADVNGRAENHYEMWRDLRERLEKLEED